MNSTAFDENHILSELKHYLPSQTPIKDFIHHNTLHAYQHMKFYDAIFKAGKTFGYQVTLELDDFRRLYKTGRIKAEILERVIVGRKGIDNVGRWKELLLSKKYTIHNEPRIGQLRANWKNLYGIDLDNLVQPLLFRVLCSYLDQGVSLWKFPVHQDGFLASVRALEKNSLSSFFKTKKARALLLDGRYQLKDLLNMVVGTEAYYEQYIFDQQFTHQGWSGIVSAIEEAPHTLLDHKKISLKDLLQFELLLELDALEFYLGKNWRPLTETVNARPINLFEDVPGSELSEVFILWQNAFEWSYYDDVLSGIALQRTKPTNGLAAKSFQAIFCIDERECSFRRHIETVDPNCETLGSPGFFGVEFYFQPDNGKFYEKLCPAPVTPKYLIKEMDVPESRKHELLYTNKTQTLIAGALSSLTLGFFAGIRLLQNIFRPNMSPAISNAYAHMHKYSILAIENKRWQ